MFLKVHIKVLLKVQVVQGYVLQLTLHVLYGVNDALRAVDLCFFGPVPAGKRFLKILDFVDSDSTLIPFL